MTAVDVFADLSAEDQAVAADLLAFLRGRGYVTVDAHGDLGRGVRVRSRAHQFPSAYLRGTGWVWAVTVKDPSSWSHTYSMPDVELVVVWDSGVTLSRVSCVAQYHVEVTR